MKSSVENILIIVHNEKTDKLVEEMCLYDY